MIAFITSIRHPQNSEDYRRVELLLEETLRSITNQSVQDFVVIIVGNRVPSFRLPPQTHFVQVAFPPPAPPDGPRTAREPLVRDKGTKIGVGLIAARQFAPDHVMIFDADDFVHRDLVRYVNNHADAAGWVIDRGLIYSRARNGYRIQDGFNRTCGTCYLLPFDAYGVPTDVDADADQEVVAAAFGDRLSSIMGAHRDAVEWHRGRGRSLDSVPFRAAVYHVDTGENHSGKALDRIARPHSNSLLELFAIRSTRGALSTFRSCYSPRAVAESVFYIAKRAARRLRDDHYERAGARRVGRTGK